MPFLVSSPPIFQISLNPQKLWIRILSPNVINLFWPYSFPVVGCRVHAGMMWNKGYIVIFLNKAHLSTKLSCPNCALFVHCATIPNLDPHMNSADDILNNVQACQSCVFSEHFAFAVSDRLFVWPHMSCCSFIIKSPQGGWDCVTDRLPSFHVFM